MGPIFCFNGDVTAGGDCAVNDTGFYTIVNFVKRHNAGTGNINRDNTGPTRGNTHGNAVRFNVHSLGRPDVIGRSRHRNRAGCINDGGINGRRLRAADDNVVGRIAGEQQIEIADAAVIVDVEARPDQTLKCRFVS